MFSVNRYTEVKFDVRYFQWYLSRRVARLFKTGLVVPESFLASETKEVERMEEKTS